MTFPLHPQPSDPSGLTVDDALPEGLELPDDWREQHTVLLGVGLIGVAVAERRWLPRVAAAYPPRPTPQFTRSPEFGAWGGLVFQVPRPVATLIDSLYADDDLIVTHICDPRTSQTSPPLDVTIVWEHIARLWMFDVSDDEPLAAAVDRWSQTVGAATDNGVDPYALADVTATLWKDAEYRDAYEPYLRTALLILARNSR